MAPSRGSDRSLEVKNAVKRGKRQAPRDRHDLNHGRKPALGLQQAVVDVFVDAFPHMLTAPHVEQALKPTLQQVKSHLYNRNFEKAFGEREYLEAYATRWSVSRALGYLEIFSDVFRQSKLEHGPADRLAAEGGTPSSQRDIVTVTCLGGGAGAELCALAALPRVSPSLENLSLVVSFVDVADWSSTLKALYTTFTSPSPACSSSSHSPTLSGDDVRPLIPDVQMKTTFHRMDLLKLSGESADTIRRRLQDSDLVTIMFTLNELYSTSLPRTQTLLLDITSNARKGAFLLVVDSAGTYSTVSVNQKEKKYPMQWLLNHTLMNLAPEAIRSAEERSITTTGGDRREKVEDGAESGVNQETQGQNDESASAHGIHTEHKQPPPPAWERVTSTDSRWFRLPDIRYPLELENMRYQLHLYQRV